MEEISEMTSQLRRGFMQIKVYPPMFIKTTNISDEGFVQLSEDACVIDLLKRIKVPISLSRLLMCSVNYKPAKLRQPLNEGDTVTFLNIVSGG